MLPEATVKKVESEKGMVRFLAWTTRAGLPAVVRYNTDLGFYCGYVGVPQGHPLYGVEYDQNTPFLSRPSDNEKLGKRGIFTIIKAASLEGGEFTQPEIAFDVHGSLTYSGGSGEFPDKKEFPGCWWFGFDAGHAGDARSDEYCDQMSRISNYNYKAPGDVFRNSTYIMAECESLALQIVEKTWQLTLWESVKFLAGACWRYIRALAKRV